MSDDHEDRTGAPRGDSADGAVARIAAGRKALKRCLKRSRSIVLACLLALPIGGAAQPLRHGPGQDLEWANDPEFADDVFTFVRIRYDAGRRYGGWRNDYPDCDLNFSYRLQQLTSIAADPDGLVLELTDERLFDHPFVYMSNVNEMRLTQAEVEALRTYLLNGGFLMADDFWGAPSWRHVYRQMKRVFPDREPQDLPLDHEIFHIVYDIQDRPQVPSYDAIRRGVTFEYWHGPTEGDEEPHFQAFFDDGGRVCALLCHNNDIGDGWEREGTNPEYFDRYSVKLSYPLGINIVVYAMTH